MTEAAALALVTAIIGAAPGIIADVEKLVADLKGRPAAQISEADAVKSAMDPLLSALKAEAAARARG